MSGAEYREKRVRVLLTALGLREGSTFKWPCLNQKREVRHGHLEGALI